MKIPILACMAATIPLGLLQADLIHHYTFDTDLSDSGTIPTALEHGAASSLSTGCSRVGGGALVLTAANATDTRPAAVPTGVPSAGNLVNGWDGASTYSNLDPGVEMANGDIFTVAAWIRPGSNFGDGNPTLVSFGTTTGNGIRMSFRLQSENGNAILRNEIQGGNIRATVAQMSGKIPGLTTLADGNWHHVAMVVPVEPGTQGDVILYIDGVQFLPSELTIGTGTRAFATGVGALHIGDGINGLDRDYNGAIDDVRIYDTALDQTAIQALITYADTSGAVVTCFGASSTDVYLGQSTTLTWDTFGTLTSLDIDNGVGSVLGQNSITVAPTAATTYTITGNRGGTVETQQVTINVVTTPDISLVAIPPSTDGTVPVELAWTSTSFEESRITSTVAGKAGLVITDTSGPNFTTLDPAGAYRADFGAAGIDPSSAFLDPASTTSTTFTLLTDIATEPLTRYNPAGSGNNDRSYVAWAPDAIEAGILDQTRWLNSLNPNSFQGDNGAAEFRDNFDVAVNRGDPNVVSDASFPGITESYSFGAALGSARMGYGANPPAQQNGDDSVGLECWFKPTDLMGGEQLIYELGGLNEGMYLALVGDVLSVYVQGTYDYVQLDHTLTAAQWTHVVVNINNTMDDTDNDTVELYVDNVLIATSAPFDLNVWADGDPSAIAGVSGDYIAGGPVNTQDYFEGEVAVFAMFNNPLTAEQVNRNYLAGTQDPIGMAAYLAGTGYEIVQILGTTTLSVDDNDPATTPSPLFATTDPVTIASGSFTTPFNVTKDTTYTATAAIGANPPATADADVTVGAVGTHYGFTILSQGPLAYYSFEEQAGATVISDVSGNGYHSTNIVGSPGLGDSGMIGNSVTLDGASSLRIGLTMDPEDPDGDGNNFEYDPTGNPGVLVDPEYDGSSYVEGWSISVLIRPDVAALGDTQIMAAQTNGSGTGRSNFYLFNDGTLTSFLGGGASPTEPDGIDDVRAASAGWSHAVLTAISIGNGVYELRFYMDGALVGQDPDVDIESATGEWVIGSHKDQTRQWFIGRLDEVAFFDFPLDDPNLDGSKTDSMLPDQVSAFYNDPLAPGLISFSVTDLHGASDGIVGPDDFDGADLVTKVSANAASATIDQGVGSVTIGGWDAQNVLPTETTTYTLDVDGVQQSVTVTVLGPVEITNTGFNGTDQFFLSATNLVPGLTYDMSYNDDLSDSGAWSPAIAAPLVAPASTTQTFTDQNAYDPMTFSKLFYALFEVTP